MSVLLVGAQRAGAVMIGVDPDAVKPSVVGVHSVGEATVGADPEAVKPRDPT